KIVTAAPFRAQTSTDPFLSPQGGAQRQDNFFGRSARQSRFAERKAMIDREHDLAITKQAQVLRVSRGSVYYLPRPVSATDLEVMRRNGTAAGGTPRRAGSRHARRSGKFAFPDWLDVANRKMPLTNHTNESSPNRQFFSPELQSQPASSR